MEAKKELGQHFLVNKGVAFNIAQRLKDEPWVVEIGPGKGALTQELLKLKLNVIGVEIDIRLIEFLEAKFKEYKGFFIILGDGVNFKVRNKVSVCGNLPYYASKQIIMNFVFQHDFIEKMVFMVQKEVGEIIIAKPKDKNFNKFSVLCQLFYDAAKLFDVSKGSFRPIPKVDSSVVEFRKRKKTYNVNEKFFSFLNVLFAHPRKTIKNNLGLNVEREIAQKRPSDLTIEEIYKLWREEWQNQ